MICQGEYWVSRLFGPLQKGLRPLLTKVGRKANPLSNAFLAMLDCTVFLTSDFPAVAVVVCSEEEAAHGFDRLSHKVSEI